MNWVRPLPGTVYLCVCSPKKIYVLTQPVFIVYPIMQNKSSSYEPLLSALKTTLQRQLELAGLHYKISERLLQYSSGWTSIKHN